MLTFLPRALPRFTDVYPHSTDIQGVPGKTQCRYNTVHTGGWQGRRAAGDPGSGGPPRTHGVGWGRLFEVFPEGFHRRGRTPRDHDRDPAPLGAPPAGTPAPAQRGGQGAGAQVRVGREGRGASEKVTSRNRG